MPKFNYKIKDLEKQIKKILESKDSSNKTFKQQIEGDLCRSEVNIGLKQDIIRSTFGENQPKYDADIIFLSEKIKEEYNGLTSAQISLLAELTAIYLCQTTTGEMANNFTSIFSQRDDISVFLNSNRKIEIQEGKIIFYIDLQCIFCSGNRDVNNTALKIGELKYTIDYKGNVTTEFSQVHEEYYIRSNISEEQISVSDEDKQSIAKNLDLSMQAMMMETTNKEPFMRIDSQVTQDQIRVLLALERLVLSPNFEENYNQLDKNAVPSDSYNYSQNLTDKVQNKIGDKDIKPLIAFVEANLEKLCNINVNINSLVIESNPMLWQKACTATKEIMCNMFNIFMQFIAWCIEALSQISWGQYTSNQSENLNNSQANKVE